MKRSTGTEEGIIKYLELIKCPYLIPLLLSAPSRDPCVDRTGDILGLKSFGFKGIKFQIHNVIFNSSAVDEKRFFCIL